MSDDTQLSMYDDLAARHNAAYAAFRSIYEAKLPKPESPVIERDSLFIPAALVIMILASVIVSGSRTVFEFGGGLVGIMAFVMLEGAIIAYAFYRTRRNFSEHRLDGVRKLANFGLGLAFIVAVGANVHAVLRERGVQTAEWINTGILVMVAISAPTLAFISGDIMAVETMANATKTRREQQKYQAAMGQWAKELNEAWAREKSRWGVKIEVEREPVSSLSVQSVQLSTGQTGHGQGYSRESKAASIVRAHLDSHPEDMSIPLRELAVKLGVGKSTVGNVLREYKK
jgi:hypothetical protein